jgi:zinc transport system substrate-binding protein
MNQRLGKTCLLHQRRHTRLLGVLALVGTALATTASMAEMVVYTVNYPLAYFAERIGGDSVSVRFPAPEHVDPAFWKPGPEIIAAYQSADLILLNGAGYAGWVAQASLPRRKLVDTSRSFRDAYLPGEETPVHQHGPAGEHAHGKVAFTTWLDPEQAIAQARAIEAAFAKRHPEDASGYSKRADALVNDLERLDCELAASVGVLANEPLLASHPVYAYLARRYGLDLRSVTWEPDLDPGEAGWRALDALLSEKSARWMLWEALPTEATRQKLEARGVGVIVFELASNRPVQGDYLSIMNANLVTLGHAAGQKGALRPSCAGWSKSHFAG